MPPLLTDRPGQYFVVFDRPPPPPPIIKGHWVLILQIPFNGSRGEVENVSVNQRTGRPSWFSDRLKKYELGIWRRDLASCQVSSNPFSACRKKSTKFQPIRDQGGHLVFFFSIGPKKNTNFVDDVEILLPAKFDWILSSGCRKKVNNIPANQRPGWPSCFFFFDRPKKHKLWRWRWDLASSQVWLNPRQRLQRSR